MLSGTANTAKLRPLRRRRQLRFLQFLEAPKQHGGAGGNQCRRQGDDGALVDLVLASGPQVLVWAKVLHRVEHPLLRLFQPDDPVRAAQRPRDATGRRSALEYTPVPGAWKTIHQAQVRYRRYSQRTWAGISSISHQKIKRTPAVKLRPGRGAASLMNDV